MNVREQQLAAIERRTLDSNGQLLLFIARVLLSVEAVVNQISVANDLKELRELEAKASPAKRGRKPKVTP